jgi:hypothetical protein
MRPRGFDIEDALTPAPMTASAGVPAFPAGFGSGPPRGQSLFSPPRPSPSARGYAEPPLVLNQPQTIDFRGAVTAMLPDKKSGPPTWIAAVLVLASLVGGAVLAHRFVDTEAAALATPPPVVHVEGKRPNKGSDTSPASTGATSPSVSAPEHEGASKLAPRPTTELDAEAVPLADEPGSAGAAPATKGGSAKGPGASSSAKPGKAAKHGKAAKRGKKTAQKRRGKH